MAGASLDATRRYAMAWRLNRDPHASLTARKMDIIGTPGRFGSYSLAGCEVAESGGVSRFKGRYCFGWALTKRYVFHPKMRTADYELSDADALRQLATIGCSHVHREPYAPP
jgi:hypothetical protein